MELVGDFHVHTKWCGHAKGDMEEYVMRAVELDLPAIAFTAHFPVPVPNKEKVCLDPEEIEVYVAEAKRLKRAFRGSIEVVMAFEADYIEKHRDLVVRECIERWDPDFVMGSIHVIDDWPFDSPGYQDGYAKWDITELYREYYGRLEKLVESGLFNVLGHIDLVKKFGYRPEGDVSGALHSLLDRIAASGMLMEANTAGFDKPVGEMYPSLDILKAARERGIPITMGSDSHAPGEVGRHFTEAVALLEQAGYEELSRPDHKQGRS
jgi:histidinol-phosphatase (PHP family)